jgi:hypothetical protein
MMRRLLVLVTAVLLLFGASAIGPSVASAPASTEPGGGGMVCNSDRNGVWGWIYNIAIGGDGWHICTYGGADRHGYWSPPYAAWVRGWGQYWYTNRWHWCWLYHCTI